MSKMLNPDIVSGRDINGEIRLEIVKELGINKAIKHISTIMFMDNFLIF